MFAIAAGIVRLRMKTRLYSSVALLVFVLTACSERPDYKISGAQWLEAGAGGGMYDVLAYPLNEDELVYLEQGLEAIEGVASKNRGVWEQIATGEDLVWAASQKGFWSEVGLIGGDVIAVSLKLTFLWEFASAEENLEADIRESLAFVEARSGAGGANAERLATADSLRALLTVIEAHKESGAFEFYAKNKARIDAALDRFTSIGDE